MRGPQGFVTILLAAMLSPSATWASDDPYVQAGPTGFDVATTNRSESRDTVERFEGQESGESGSSAGAAASAPERIISPTRGCTFIPYEGTDADVAQSRPNAVVDEECFAEPDPTAPAAAQPAPPQITQAMVRRAFEQVPVPELSSQTQPVDKTLVNFDTIFYVDAQPMTETVTLLGQQVTLFIEPSTYRWDHGDGSEVTTYSPGAAYPSKEIVHRYMQARQTVRHQVSIDWTATYSVNGGPAQPVPGAVTTVGPETPLRISEAAPALSGDHSG